ncbi:hypothetical protein LWI28_012765 [Acer negundo]|uniref:Uncharacterized protein n=1 Tax=Acer negundo TaxID=4023 RepID=A0AAD5JSN9_ACENE|nr:hypothetical protein LWI28_012765 [Acer negundo]
MFRSSGYGFNHSWSLKHIHVMSVPGGTTDAGGPASKFAPGGGVVMNLASPHPSVVVSSGGPLMEPLSSGDPSQSVERLFR